MRRLLKHHLAVIVGVGLSASVATSALAYWTTSGSGTGSASIGTLATVTITEVGRVTDLRPGGPAQPINFRVTNRLPNVQHLNAVRIDFTVTPDAGATAGDHVCETDDFVLLQPEALDADLATGDRTFLRSGASLQMRNSATNQDNCKNATIALSFVAA